MATFSTYAEVLRPDHVMMKMYRAGVEKQHPGIVLADLLRQTGGAYETTTPLTERFRGYIRAVAERTADDVAAACPIGRSAREPHDYSRTACHHA